VKLTNGQTKAYDKVMAWAKDESSDWSLKLGGYAGTGKTTLLKKMVEGMKKPPFCCAPTGKAASVLQGKLGEDALVTTVHKALYSAIIPSDDYFQALACIFCVFPSVKIHNKRMDGYRGWHAH